MCHNYISHKDYLGKSKLLHSLPLLISKQSSSPLQVMVKTRRQKSHSVCPKPPKKLKQPNVPIKKENVHFQSLLTKLVSSKQGPLCRTLQWGVIGPQQNSWWTNSRPPAAADHAQWSSCSQHSASVPINTDIIQCKQWGKKQWSEERLTFAISVDQE